MKRLTMTQFEKKYGVKFTRNHTAKMAGVVSLSTSVELNPECPKRRKIKGSICEKCYAASMQARYSNLAEMLRRNHAVLTTTLIPVEDIPLVISESGYARFEAFADLATTIQCANYFNFAKYNPHLKWALWTKNPWIVERAISEFGLEKPENLTIIGSSYFVNEAMSFEKYWFIDKVFTVYDKAYIAENGVEINCGGRSCADCGRCYENYGGTEVSEQLK